MNTIDNHKIKISDVAQQTGMGAPLVRKLMRDGILPIGFCVKHGYKWYYYVIEKDLRNVFGDDVTDRIIEKE